MVDVVGRAVIFTMSCGSRSGRLVSGGLEDGSDAGGRVRVVPKSLELGWFR